MRLIDADELLTAFPIGDEPTVTIACIRATIKHMPTIEERKTVVRCKDCKYRNGDYCHRFHDGYSAFIHHDDYCSYAERGTNE